MMRTLTYLVLILPVLMASSCAEKQKRIAPLSILGLTEKQVISKLGEPGVRGTPRDGLEEFMYQDIRLDVWLEDGTVTACVIRDASPVPLNDRIRCGVPIAEVTQMYGMYTSEEEVADGTTSHQYRSGVLYHRRLPSGDERYKLRYPSKNLLFTFYPDKTLHSVWIGRIY
ncbi:MAG: hypothetical protein ACYS5V_06125 [Planctomycetota bacterium]|jgi:hypothetical protein